MTFAQAFRTSHRAAVDALDGELALAGARILLVSSDELARARLARRMVAGGASVTAVRSVEEALALVRVGYRPDLMVDQGP